MKTTLTLALSTLALNLPVCAQILVSTTGAAAQVSGADAVQVNNFNVPGFGNASARFVWSPMALGFVVDPASLVVAGQSSCVKKIYSEPRSTYGVVQVSTRTINGVEYGGLIDIGVKSPTDWTVANIWNNFTIAWAKTARQEDNPYLKGQTVANFSAAKAYGFVSTYNQYGFTQNDLVEINGNVDADDFLLIKQVNGNNSYQFNQGARKVSTLGCISGTGTYTEHNSRSSVVIAGDSAGFMSNYNTLNVNWLVSSGAGVVAASSEKRPQTTYTYGGLSKNDLLRVQDVGNGFSMVALDTDGKVVGSFVVMTPY